MATAFIQVPAYQEPHLRSTLRAIRGQVVPEAYEVEREAWVTPGADASAPAECSTVQAAAGASGWTVFEAPEGKLSARNAAHAHAVEAGADVIVTWDADAEPHHDYVLDRLLAPYGTGGVIGTNGNPVSMTLVGPVVNLFSHAEDAWRPHLHGQLSSFRAEGWREAGPFDTDEVDETDINQVRAEEEFNFHDRLTEHGVVIDVEPAKVENDPRRHLCTIDRAFGRFGQCTRRVCRRRRRGTVSFAPYPDQGQGQGQGQEGE